MKKGADSGKAICLSEDQKSRFMRLFLERVDNNLLQNTKTCWEWKGNFHPDGYGRIDCRIDKSRLTIRAHRLSYALHKGAIPAGLLVRHSCNNPRCVNPYHLHLGNSADNVRDMVAANRQVKGDRHWKRQLALQGKQPKGAEVVNATPGLTDNIVAEMRRLKREGISGKQIWLDIRSRYDLNLLTYCNVRKILQGKNWQHVK